MKIVKKRFSAFVAALLALFAATNTSGSLSEKTNPVHERIKLIQQVVDDCEDKPFTQKDKWLAQWVNWPNWQNWGNWPDWNNWNNWYNWYNY